MHGCACVAHALRIVNLRIAGFCPGKEKVSGRWLWKIWPMVQYAKAKGKSENRARGYFSSTIESF